MQVKLWVFSLDDHAGISSQVFTTEIEADIAKINAICIDEDERTTAMNLLEANQGDELFDYLDRLRDPLNTYSIDCPTINIETPAEKLMNEYDRPSGRWGEHPDYLMEDWREEVAIEDVRSGYWDWVVTQMELALDGPKETEDA